MTTDDTTDPTWLDEAVGAALIPVWDEMQEQEQQGYVHSPGGLARAAILAALPAINEGHVQVATCPGDFVVRDGWGDGYEDGRNDAADQARSFGWKEARS